MAEILSLHDAVKQSSRRDTVASKASLTDPDSGGS